MQVNLSLTPGYRLKITRASRMSELVDRTITGLAAIGGSAAFLEILRRWLQRRQEKRQEQLQLDVRIMEEGHAPATGGLPARVRGPEGPGRRARAPPQGRAYLPGSPDAGEAGGPYPGQRSPHPAPGRRDHWPSISKLGSSRVAG